MRKPRYKNPHLQAAYEAWLKVEYPINKMSGSENNNWMFGYEGTTKKPPFASFGLGYVIFYAGKEKRRLDDLKKSQNTGK